MHKTMKYISSLLLPMMLLAACGRVEQPVGEEAGEHTCALHLVGGVVGFDAGTTKADGDFVFSSENRFYVRMKAGDKVVLGTASYSDETAAWTFTYNGSLDGATQGSAHAVLFERADRTTAFKVDLNFRYAIYEDPDASFSVDASGITLNATLTPKTGRISFVHDCEPGNGRWFSKMGGISYYDSFSLSDFSFSSKDMFQYESSYSFNRDSEEYLYGFFTNPEDPYFFFVDGSYYYRHFPPGIFQPGQSGYVDHPDVDPAAWERHEAGKYFWLSGVKGSSGKGFYMRYVPAGSFSMGSDEMESARPVHTVTLPHYYIGETEVTKDMWFNVMGEPSDWANNIAPANYRSYSEIQEFITALNQKTGYRFRLPTEAEWEFAARGGIFSRGYAYSGGNVFDDVVRRGGDFAVKTKNANELGIYDMSGNVAELCNDWYGPYSADAQTNPTGPAAGTSRVVRGGYIWDWDDVNYRFKVWGRSQTDDYGSDRTDAVGFRLAMDVPVVEY